jgi:S-adenosylmethionine decarboxylase
LKMQALGRHILAEIYGCEFSILNDLDKIRDILVSAAISAGAEVRETAFHRFSPQGVSGVVVISESHLSIHTWPELGYAALDVFTCGEKVDPWVALEEAKKGFRATSVKASEYKRGLVEETDTQCASS